ncbi:hypothetical protein Tco_0616598, partial [Tanacetum coccineum]
MTWCAQNARNRAKSTVVCRQGSRTLAALRDRQEEMQRVHGLCTYTDDQIMAMVRGGKQRGHIPSFAQKSNKQLQKQIDMITKAMSSDNGYSQLFMQLQSQHESGSANGSGAAIDDESDDDEDVEEDKEDA